MEAYINAVTLYGTPLSLYTGHARSYLIKAGINYRETTPTTTHFLKDVVPKAGARQRLQLAAQAMLAACDMSELLEIKLSRKIGRSDNLEVWV